MVDAWPKANRRGGFACWRGRAGCAAGHQAAPAQQPARVRAVPRLANHLTDGLASKLTLVCARPASARRPCWPLGSQQPAAGGLAVAGRRRQRTGRVNQLAAETEPIVLILDDYHLIEALPCMRRSGC
jgi:hypothetical protein